MKAKRRAVTLLSGGVANDVWSLRVYGELRSVAWVRGATPVSRGRLSYSNTSTAMCDRDGADPARTGGWWRTG